MTFLDLGLRDRLLPGPLSEHTVVFFFFWFFYGVLNKWITFHRGQAEKSYSCWLHDHYLYLWHVFLWIFNRPCTHHRLQYCCTSEGRNASYFCCWYQAIHGYIFIVVSELSVLMVVIYYIFKMYNYRGCCWSEVV